MELNGRRVLLVGGTSGLGLAAARAVALRGGVPFVASRRRSSVDAALAALPAQAQGATVDLRDEDSIADLIRVAGPIDHLVYTAGEPLRLTRVADLDAAAVSAFWATRFVGAMTLVKHAAPAIREGGSIVLTSGNAGRRPAAGWALGASICGAMDALTRELALELAPIRVNAVAPGITRSPLWSTLPEEDQHAMYDGLAAALPVARVGTPDDVALAYVYAMEQDMATGTSILVDGGAVLV